MEKKQEASVNFKIDFLKCALAELLKETLNSKTTNNKQDKDIVMFDMQFLLSLEKIILYPFFLSTANGWKSRNEMFSYVFTDFKSNNSGIYELEIEEEIIKKLGDNLINKELFNPYFDIVNLESNTNKLDYSKIYLIPVWNEINEFDYKNCDFSKDSQDNTDIEFPKLAKHAVKHILKKYKDFVTFPIDTLRDLSFYHKSWNFLKMINENTDFDNAGKGSYIKNLFETQDSPLTPLISE